MSVCVSDGALTTCQDVAVTVDEVNLPPDLTAIPARTVKEGELLTFTAVGSDGDLPKQTLSFSLVKPPTGAVINSETGVFTWIPNLGQGLQNYLVKVCVSDGLFTSCQEVTMKVDGVSPTPMTKIYLPIISR